jgi:hypothetical protein
VAKNREISGKFYVLDTVYLRFGGFFLPIGVRRKSQADIFGLPYANA